VQGIINRGRHTDHPARRHSMRTNSAHFHHPPCFLQAGCPSCHPTNSVKALKAKSEDFSFYINMNAHFITSTTTKVADTWIRDFAMRSDTNRPHHSMDITLTQRHSKLPHCAPGNTVLHRYCIYICLSAFFQDNLGKSAPER